MKKLVVIFIFFLGCAYYIWYFANTRPGEQKVQFEASERECFSEVTDGSRYCIHNAKHGNNGAIVYHLHGRNQDEGGWNDDNFYTALIQKYWANSGRKPPVVVTISYGPIWLLVPKGIGKKSGLLDVFIDETIPRIEKRLGFTPIYRAIAGESMGGLNSLIAGLRRPEMFQRVVGLCSAVYRISPFDPWASIWNEMKISGAEPKTIGGIIFISRDYVQNVAEWNAINPLELIKTLKKENSPAIYLSAPLYDKYGIFEGNQQMADIAHTRELNLKWQPLYGGHCAIDINSVAEFLL